METAFLIETERPLLVGKGPFGLFEKGFNKMEQCMQKVYKIDGCMKYFLSKQDDMQWRYSTAYQGISWSTIYRWVISTRTFDGGALIICIYEGKLGTWNDKILLVWNYQRFHIWFFNNQHEPEYCRSWRLLKYVAWKPLSHCYKKDARSQKVIFLGITIMACTDLFLPPLSSAFSTIICSRRHAILPGTILHYSNQALDKSALHCIWATTLAHCSFELVPMIVHIKIISILHLCAISTLYLTCFMPLLRQL